MEMDEGMKKVLWIFSVLYVAIPSVVIWYLWTGDVTLREGLESKGKLYITGVCILLAIVANWVAWSNYFRWKKIWGENEKRQN